MAKQVKQKVGKKPTKTISKKVVKLEKVENTQEETKSVLEQEQVQEQVQENSDGILNQLSEKANNDYEQTDGDATENKSSNGYGVSCLMLTYDRPLQKPVPSIVIVKNSIDQFARQTYEDKELVVVNSGSEQYYKEVEEYLKEIAEAYGFTYIHKHVSRIDYPSIADLRNLSLDLANKEFVMTFDDDDVRSETLIETEMNEIKNKGLDACFIKRILVRMELGKQPFACDYGRSFEPSMIARKPKSVRYHGLHSDTTFVAEIESEENYKIGIIEKNDFSDYEYCYWNTNISSREQFVGIILSSKNKTL